MKKTLGFLAVLTLSACNQMPPGVYYNHGDPENLLDVSSEVVSLSVATPGALAQFASTITQDPPARAELGCQPSEPNCVKAKKMLDTHHIPAEWSGDADTGVKLIYERIVARDCENRFIDNTINPYNLQSPTLGCSVAGNTVQMVSDKKQFVNPGLLDFQDGETAARTRDHYESSHPAKPSDSTARLGSITSTE